MKHRIWMLVILGLLVISLSFSFQVISDPPTDEEEEPITFLASVSIDGFIDDSPGPGLIGEWEDAISQNFGLTGEKDNGFPDFGVRYKVVSDKILVGMTFPRNSISINFEKIVVTFDMNGDKKLTNGDARINIENGGINEGVYYVEAFDNDGFANIEEIGPGLKLNGQIPQTISIAQVAMKTTEQQFTIEMGLSRALFGKLVGLVTNDYIQGVLGQVGFSIILIDGEGTPYGYPGIPVIVSDTNLGKEYYAVGTYHNFVFDLQVPENYAVNVGITDIEVTQAVSSPSDNIIFVANKPTLARVYFDNPTPFPLQAEVTLSIIDSTFLGSIFGYNISGSMTQTITIPTTTNRENLDHSANFLFPMSWTIQDGVLPRLLRAEINPINFIRIRQTMI